MSLKEKEAVCDEIVQEQPTLFGSVLVLGRMGVAAEHVEVLLEALIVTHLALKASCEQLRPVTEQEHESELRRLVATMRFSEGLSTALTHKSIKQYVGYRKEPWLFAYVTALLHEHGIVASAEESSKYAVLAGINLVGCVANAHACR